MSAANRSGDILSAFVYAFVAMHGVLEFGHALHFGSKYFKIGSNIIYEPVYYPSSVIEMWGLVVDLPWACPEAVKHGLNTSYSP